MQAETSSDPPDEITPDKPGNEVVSCDVSTVKQEQVASDATPSTKQTASGEKQVVNEEKPHVEKKDSLSSQDHGGIIPSSCEGSVEVSINGHENSKSFITRNYLIDYELAPRSHGEIAIEEKKCFTTNYAMLNTIEGAKIFLLDEEDIVQIKEQSEKEDTTVQPRFLQSLTEFMLHYPLKSIYIRMFGMTDSKTSCFIWVVLLDDVRELIPLVLKKQQKTVTPHQQEQIERLCPKSGKEDQIKQTMSVQQLEILLENFGIKKDLITLVSDIRLWITQIQSKYFGIEMVGSRDRDGEWVMFPSQAVLFTFANLITGINWKKCVCQDHPTCLQDYKMKVLGVMEKYTKINDTNFVFFDNVLKDINDLRCHCVFRNQRKNSVGMLDYALKNIHPYDQTSNSQLEVVIEKFGLTNVREQHPKTFRYGLNSVWQARVIYLLGWIEVWLNFKDTKATMGLLFAGLIDISPDKNFTNALIEFFDTKYNTQYTVCVSKKGESPEKKNIEEVKSEDSAGVTAEKTSDQQLNCPEASETKTMELTTSEIADELKLRNPNIGENDSAKKEFENYDVEQTKKKMATTAHEQKPSVSSNNVPSVRRGTSKFLGTERKMKGIEPKCTLSCIYFMNGEVKLDNFDVSAEQGNIKLITNFTILSPQTREEHGARLFLLDEEDVKWINQKASIEKNQVCGELWNLTQFMLARPSKSVYIRMFTTKILRSDVFLVLVEDVREMLHVVLMKQQITTITPEIQKIIDKYCPKSRNSRYRKTMSVELLEVVLQELDIDKDLITLVHDMRFCLSRKKNYDNGVTWTKLMDRDGKWVIFPSDAILMVFQSLITGINWNDDMCQDHPACLDEYRSDMVSLIKLLDKNNKKFLMSFDAVQEAIDHYKRKCAYRIQRIGSNSNMYDYELKHHGPFDLLPNEHYENVTHKFGLEDLRKSYPKLFVDSRNTVWQTRALYLLGWVESWINFNDTKSTTSILFNALINLTHNLNFVLDLTNFLSIRHNTKYAIWAKPNETIKGNPEDERIRKVRSEMLARMNMEIIPDFHRERLHIIISKTMAQETANAANEEKRKISNSDKRDSVKDKPGNSQEKPESSEKKRAPKTLEEKSIQTLGTDFLTKDTQTSGMEGCQTSQIAPLEEKGCIEITTKGPKGNQADKSGCSKNEKVEGTVVDAKQNLTTDQLDQSKKLKSEEKVQRNTKPNQPSKLHRKSKLLLGRSNASPVLVDSIKQALNGRCISCNESKGMTKKAKNETKVAETEAKQYKQDAMKKKELEEENLILRGKFERTNAILETMRNDLAKARQDEEKIRKAEKWEVEVKELRTKVKNQAKELSQMDILRKSLAAKNEMIENYEKTEKSFNEKKEQLEVECSTLQSKLADLKLEKRNEKCRYDEFMNELIEANGNFENENLGFKEEIVQLKETNDTYELQFYQMQNKLKEMERDINYQKEANAKVCGSEMILLEQIKGLKGLVATFQAENDSGIRNINEKMNSSLDETCLDAPINSCRPECSNASTSVSTSHGFPSSQPSSSIHGILQELFPNQQSHSLDVPPTVSNQEYPECSICLLSIRPDQEQFRCEFPNCQLYHLPCIREWLNKDSNCPACRQHMRDPAQYPELN